MASEEKIVGRWREGLQDGVGVVEFYPGELFVRWATTIWMERFRLWPSLSATHHLTSKGARIYLQALTRRHVPCATCHPSTHDRHRCRSGVLVRRLVPRRSRSDQPFGLYSRKCLNTHTDKYNPPTTYLFSPTRERKSSFNERSMLKHLNIHSLRFWRFSLRHSLGAHQLPVFTCIFPLSGTYSVIFARRALVRI